MPLQIWVIRWPSANDQPTVQPLSAAVPARTVTSPWKPPGHWLTIRYVVLQAPGGALVGGVVGRVVGGVVGGDVDGRPNE
ncbi:hypothetical protein RB614_11095 [Phytohabitans sp. ZYX-F-186]|uniref:Uncharacterized protein n=1 Tax=Phytohabitans maris TaxID=3071409 RepID=A0ABU0ZDE0_9ACTN|nr:hypothetical protein [Phytohabitans sp. ZYX-F-186]MDQ7905067.1 hypothetical protein [Phytohabitans sp. ZYX-F-186]